MNGHHLLTRGHHGAGFWDRGLGTLGDRLTEASQSYGSTDDHILWDNGDGTAVTGYEERKCPSCGEVIWDRAHGHHLNKCWGCGLAFD